MNLVRALVTFPFRRLAVLCLLFLAACATAPHQPGAATAGPPIQASPIVPIETWTPRPDPPPTSTPTSAMATWLAEISTPSPYADPSPGVKMPCPKEELDGYLAGLDPIAAQHLQDAKIAQTVDTLDAQQIESYQHQAEQRLETLKTFVPPACARATHEQFIAGFEKLVQAWEAARENDLEAAKEILRSSYADIAGAIAILSGN